MFLRIDRWTEGLAIASGSSDQRNPQNKVRGKLCLQTRTQRLVSWRSLISNLGACVALWRLFQYPNGFGTSEIYLVVSGAGIIEQGSGALEPPHQSTDQCFIHEW